MNSLPSADNPLDQTLVEHVEAGEWLDLAGDEPVDPQEMHAWGADRTISATVLRDIVRGVATANPDPRGLRLRGARISGRLDLAYIKGSIPVVLNECLLPDGLNASDAHLPDLNLEGCVVEQPFIAIGLTTTELSLRRATVTAAVILDGAELGDLDCWGATITNPDGAGLAANSVRVRRNALLGGGFTVTTTAGDGAVVLTDAEIGEVLFLDTTLRGGNGPALMAENLRVHRCLMLGKGFTASGAGVLGTIYLDGAELGELDIADAVVANRDGAAISADGTRVHREASFRRCTATSTGDGGAVTLIGAEVGELTFHTVTVESTADTALWASDLRVHRDLSLRDSDFTAGGRGYAVCLDNAHVGGDISLSGALLTHRDPHYRLYLDGLTYAALPLGILQETWLALLRDATPAYAAQPYQQLAAVHRAAGHDSQARRVLMAQRRDQLARRALTGRAERAWVRFTGFALGYGYQPWRALIGLLLVVATAVTLAVGLDGSLVQAADPRLPCPVVERIAVGLDLGTPLLNARSRCDITTSGAGQVLTVTGWLLRLLAWAFATLFIAGFTSAVRRT